MLTLGQQVVIESFVKELVKLIQNAILTKQIDRVSIRNGKRTRFKSPVSASGNLAKTISYQISDTGISIFANDYIYELIYGKKPAATAMGINHNLEKDIRKWMDDKGIALEEDGDKRNSIAHLITNKIQKYGSSIYLASYGNNSGLLENVVTEQLISEYNTNFTKQLEIEFRSAFVNG